jgi:Ni/Fe-hydrogenase subunit HybB-like protein
MTVITDNQALREPQTVQDARPDGPDEIAADVVATLGPPSAAHKVFVLTLLLICAWGVVAYVYQLRRGLAATGMSNYFSWGVYIVNFVFFIGISHAGTLVSAILRVTGAEWRRPITRMAEGITVFALVIGAPMIVIDMGRPDRILNVVLHARLQSPILWDVLSVTTYLCGSLLYLYLPMIPDLALLRDLPAGTVRALRFGPVRRWVYRKMALGWQGTPEQWRRLERAISAMAVVIIPVAVSVHTVVSWIFGMTLRPGWHSTIFGPYFVVGAIFSGIAALITAMALFVWCFRAHHLDRYVTPAHFKKLALLLLAVNLIYIYFTISEYLTMGYPSDAPDRRLLGALFGGQYALQFWAMAVVGLFVPAVLLSLPWTRNLKGIVIAAVLINVGMWLKRYVIVVPTLGSPFMPAPGPAAVRLTYTPTWVEWSITAAAFAGFCLLYLLFSKVFPIVSIWEVRGAGEERPTAARGTQRVVAPAGLPLAVREVLT